MNLLDAVYVVVGGVTAPWWARKQRCDWGERFGKITPVGDRAGMERVLIHAVSVGEVNALRELMPLLVRKVHVILSVGTDTGIKRARELFGATCDVVRYPLDASWAVRRFLDRTRPDAVALVELELWPNFVKACRSRGIPVCVINGRLSERSFKGYRKLRWFLKGVFGSLEFAAVQDEAYAERFVAMGVPRERVRVTGSMKWDSARIEDDVPGAEALAREMGIARGEGSPPLIVAGSTGPDEEALLVGAVAEVEKEVGAVQLLCAPRKPERFDEAAGAMPGCVRRSEGRVGSETRRFLLDTIGELRKAYALADVVVVGRSFGDLFGSDPIEPIALGKATVIGPAVSDFAAIVGVFERGGGIVRATRETLAAELKGLLRDEGKRRKVAGAGRECIRKEQGASQRHAEMVMELVGVRSGGAP